jgi:hypothetical protein
VAHVATGGIVGVFDILKQIDHEINQLKQARALLDGTRTLPASRNAARKRTLTPEGRRRIVEAVKRRWAAQRKKRVFEAVG